MEVDNETIAAMCKEFGLPEIPLFDSEDKDFKLREEWKFNIAAEDFVGYHQQEIIRLLEIEKEIRKHPLYAKGGRPENGPYAEFPLKNISYGRFDMKILTPILNEPKLGRHEKISAKTLAELIEKPDGELILRIHGLKNSYFNPERLYEIGKCWEKV